MAEVGYPTTPDGHPLIDVSPLLASAGCRADRAVALQHMGAALQGAGYFYAQNVDLLPASYLASIYEYARKLHGLPLDIKRKYMDGAYSGPDVGKLELQYEPGAVSTVRAWDYSRTRFTLASGDFDNNRYPDAVDMQPSYIETLDTLYARQDTLAQVLMVAFADMLDLPSNTFLDMFTGTDAEGDFGTIRLLYYPGRPDQSPEEAAAATSGISPHTDFEAFTLMHQDAPGLQFIPASVSEGEPVRWVQAPVRAGEFVVIVGDVLERLTNGVLRATPHRVAKTAHPRYSIIRFNAFAADTVIQPLPQFVSEERPARYSWVTMKTHMETTMRNLETGLGSWDPELQRSTTANYLYIDGADHRKVQA